jgi:hypothetical protein
MNRWLMGVAVGFIACAAGFLIATRSLAPQLTPPAIVDAVESTTTESALPEPPAPVVLAKVVDTSDIDPLLDPLEKPVTGVPFDADVLPDPSPAPTVPAPERIPPAVEDLPKGQ